jgi:hypothetical protein
METLGAVHTGAADDDEHKSFKHSCVCPERCFYALQRNAPVRREAMVQWEPHVSLRDAYWAAARIELGASVMMAMLLLWLLYVLVINQTP